MDSQKVLYSQGKNDECYTPRYVVEEIAKHLPKNKVIWCPFDTDKSEFVKVLMEQGYSVVYSHIDYGQDFFDYEPQNWDILVSNPPFTNKRKIFERALKFGKPFALLMSLTWLNDAAPKELFMNKDLELLMFRNRVKYIDANGMIMNNGITFSSAFYCNRILPKQICISNK